MTLPMANGQVDLYSLANEYVTSFGVGNPELLEERPYRRNPVELQREIAQWYEDAPRVEDSAFVTAVYQTFAREVAAQYGFLVAKGFTFSAYHSAEFHYKNSAEMIADVRFKGTLWVFDAEHNHPILWPAQNYMFRAVHDVFGHAMHGNTFGARGEFNAYLAHRDMFSRVANMAMTTETLGQNSWVNYFGDHEKLAQKDRPYASQKAVIMPGHFRVGDDNAA